MTRRPPPRRRCRWPVCPPARRCPRPRPCRPTTAGRWSTWPSAPPTGAIRFFDASVYFEYYAPREKYLGESGDKLEARIILQHQWTDWDLRLNPKFEKVLGGPNNMEPLEFEYATGLYLKVNPGMNVGLEAYGNMGEIAKMIPSSKEHYLVPTLEYNLAPELWINVGVAFGLNDKSDDVALKTYVEFEF